MSNIPTLPVSFAQAFPLKALIQNHFGHGQRAIIYIVKKTDLSSSAQTITINFTSDRSNLSLKGFGTVTPNHAKLTGVPPGASTFPANARFAPNASAYNLAIALRPGVLSKEVEKGFANSLYQAHNASKYASNPCAVSGPVSRATDGALVWYMAFANDLTTTAEGSTNELLSFTLTGISAELGEGSRNTQVEFEFGSAEPAGDTSTQKYRSAQTVDIINHDGDGYAPLRMGVLGDNTLRNQTGLAHRLSFFLQTTDGEPLALSQDTNRPTEIHFSFPYQHESTALTYMGTSSEVMAMDFESGTHQYPINTDNVGIDNGDGFIEFKATFSELEELSQSLIPVPIAQTELAIQLYNEKVDWLFQVASQSSTLENSVELDHGVDQLTLGYTSADITRLKQEAKTRSQQLAGFIQGANGPLRWLMTIHSLALEPQTVQSTWQRCASSFDLLKVYPAGSESNEDAAPSFSYTKWESFITQYGDNEWNTCLPSGMTASTDPSSTWDNPDFLNYVETNILGLCASIISYDSVGIGKPSQYSPPIKGELYQILPCTAIYEFFRVQYELEKVEGLVEDNAESMLLDIAQPFSVEQWAVAQHHTWTLPSHYRNVLNQSANGGVVQNLSDPSFVEYLKTNFKNICEQLNPRKINGKSYVTASQSLYEVFWFSYQASLPPTKAPSLDALMHPTSYEFSFTNVLLSGNNGLAPIGISLRNIPGYWDTHFQLSIRKSTTTAANTLVIGEGSSLGRTYITSSDPNYVEQGEITPSSRIDFDSAGVTSSLPNVSIEEHYGLNFYGKLGSQEIDSSNVDSTTSPSTKMGLPVTVKQADLLVVEGRLGIGNVPENKLSGDFTKGTNTASSNSDTLKLKVEGDTSLNGRSYFANDVALGLNASMNQDLKVKSSFNAQANLSSGGPLQADRLLMASGGMLVPVGTMIPRVYYYSHAPEPPDGWLVCDGTTNLINLLVGTDGTLNEDYLPLVLHIADKTAFKGQGKNGSFSSKTQIKPDPENTDKYFFYDPVNDVQSIIHVNDYKIMVPGSDPLSGLFTLTLPSGPNAKVTEAQATSHAQLVYLIKM